MRSETIGTIIECSMSGKLAVMAAMMRYSAATRTMYNTLDQLCVNAGDTSGNTNTQVNNKTDT